MAAVSAGNGQLTPPTVSSPAMTSAQKRKHEDAHSSHPGNRIQQTQRDLLQVLRPLDTTPSFLEFEFEEPTDGEPVAKKARISEGVGHSAKLANKLKEGSYTTLQLLKEDVARVGKALTETIRIKGSEGNEGNEDQQGKLSVDDLKQIQRIESYAKMIDDFLSNETQHETTNGHSAEPVKKEDAASTSLKSRLNEETTKRIATILTLFGNAPTPKQLFSSMPTFATGSGTKSVKTELPVDELSLPNGLTATNILPASGEGGQKAPTFEDTFAPPQSLPALQPPKPNRSVTTRDGSLRWEFRDLVRRDGKKGNWTMQSQSAGEWLSYGEGGPGTAHLAADEKRKQRDRALSSGETTQPSLDQAALNAALAREEEALFRRAYSSFAPSRDETKAIIPEEAKSMLWWTRLGSSKYAHTFALDPALFDGEATQESLRSSAPGADDGEIAKAVELFTDESTEYEEPEKVPKVDVDTVLREISQLLETLASHQRIRTATLPSNPSSRNPVSPGLPSARATNPDTPGDDEITVYEGLKHELAYLIMKLPPYALAKLDGCQLGQLGVGTLLNFSTKDTRGTLEEDLATRLAKYHASAAAAGVASLNRGTSSSGQHYNTTAQRTPAIGQAANTRYGQQYGASRTPASAPQFHRSGSSSSYNAARPSYGQATMYARPPAPQQTYAHPGGGQQFYGQRAQPHANYGGYSQQYGQSMHGRPSYPSSQPLAQYQQRSHAQGQHTMSYQAAASPAHMGHPGAGSPVKGGYPTQFGQALHHNHQQPGSGRSTPNNYPSQPQTPVNGFQHRPTVLPRPPSATSQANGI